MSLTIEAVIVCRGFSDFLAETLPRNIHHFDRLVVVTSSRDGKTIGLCKQWGVSHVETDVFDEHPADKGGFNKGRAINVGLAHCRARDWLLHLDADIILPERFKYMLEHARLETPNLYGSDRVDCRPEDFQKYLDAPPQFKSHFLVQSAKLPMAARLVHWDWGYVPIGFFQLWHSSVNRVYPTTSGDGAHSDVVFGIQWPRQNRILLPEVICTHLTTGTSQGEDWKGRRSPGWCRPKPPCPPCRPYCHHDPHL